MGQTRQYPHTNERVFPCKGCGKLIFMHHTGKRWMPVEYESKECHFVYCPKADKFRKSK